jgi:hypothetical protein
MQAGKEPGVADQTVDFSGGEADSSAFNAKTKFIAISGDAAFHYKVGDSGGTVTATTGSFRVAANVVLFVGVHPGSKLAVIASA